MVLQRRTQFSLATFLACSIGFFDGKWHEKACGSTLDRNQKNKWHT